MNPAYKYFTWGVVFIFLDVYIHVDIFPDFIGYILFFLGTTHVLHESPNFKKLRYLSIIMAIYSIPQFMGVTSYQIFEWKYTANWYWVMYDQLMVFGLLLFMYFLCLGIADSAKKANDQKVWKQSKVCFKLFAWCFAPLLVVFPFSMNFNVTNYAFGILITLLIIAVINLLLLFSYAHKMMVQSFSGNEELKGE